ncbi:MAG: membrane integrity-associated transporter subunit PqiC, partial [Desulfobulbaceae bacterium]|nr:membrane integrity-associated transporter subunit PqiC [Desulfobulbaceae bacterium]
MRSLLVLSVILLLSGCIGGETRPSKFYSLSATEATQSGTLVRSGGMGLRLGPFTFPDYLRRPNITTHTSGNKVEVDEYNRWAGSLEDDFHRVLGINIGALLSSGNINVYPADSRIDAKYQVAGEINAFDGKLGETVTLDIRWFVEDTKSGKTVSSK